MFAVPGKARGNFPGIYNVRHAFAAFDPQASKIVLCQFAAIGHGIESLRNVGRGAILKKNEGIFRCLDAIDPSRDLHSEMLIGGLLIGFFPAAGTGFRI
jgi:hypothetical protein